jgi:hypothetical protein
MERERSKYTHTHTQSPRPPSRILLDGYSTLYTDKTLQTQSTGQFSFIDGSMVGIVREIRYGHDEKKKRKEKYFQFRSSFPIAR